MENLDSVIICISVIDLCVCVCVDDLMQTFCLCLNGLYCENYKDENPSSNYVYKQLRFSNIFAYKNIDRQTFGQIRS